MKRFAHFALLALTFALAADAGMVGGGVQGGGPSVTAIPVPVNKGGTGSTTASGARTNLGVSIGTNVQAWDADLDAFALKAAPTGVVVGTSDTQTLSNKTLTGVSDVLEVRNGTSNQVVRIYGSFTDASNYERLALSHFGGGGDVQIMTEHAGTGSVRAMVFGTGGAARWIMNTAGHWIANLDNSYDIGQSGANRPRNLFLAGNATVGGTVTAASYTNNLSAFAATTSAQLAGVLSDETGSGAAVFGTSPTISGPTISGTTTNITSTNLQRNGNAVGMPRTFTATYDPASLAAQAVRCDAVTVTGVTTAGGAVAANPGNNPATRCVIAAVRASAADTVTVCWQNVDFGVGGAACDTASSTWTFTQAQ